MSSATTNSQENLGVDQGTHISTHRYHGAYDVDELFHSWRWGFRTGPSVSSFTEHDVGTGGFATGSLSDFTFDEALDSDTNRYFKAYIRATASDINLFGDWIGYTTYAVTATASTPTASSITSTTATIACNFFPNTNVSTASVNMQYRVLGSGAAWTDAPGGTSSYSGYAQITSFNRAITGLTGGIAYEIRMTMTRTTVNETTFTSASGTFTTTSSAPTVTTVAASSISNTSATLNSTVNPNGISCTIDYQYGTSSGVYTNTSSNSAQSGSGDRSVPIGITGLTASTPYFYRVRATYGAGLTVFGSELTFTTTVDPNILAKDAEMLPIQNFDRKYGVATTIYFVVAVPAATSSNSFYTGAPVWAGAGESKISKDGGAFADTTNDPVQVGSQLYSLTLTAAEMQCAQGFIILTDTGAAVRDTLLTVRTELQLGNAIFDSAAGSHADTSAFKVVGFGAGHGIEAIRGATAGARDIDGIIGQHFVREGTCNAGGAGTVDLDPNAVNTNNYYDNLVISIVAGAGAGQSRYIISYAAANKRCTVDASWTTNPDNTSQYVINSPDRTWQQYRGELSAVPADAGTYGDKFQLILQRFSYKIEQTATLQTMRKADNVTALGTRVVADAAGTQSIAKLA